MLRYYTRTDVGRKRKQNEDAFLAREDLSLFVVADGVGGRKAGELASAITVDTFEVAGPRIRQAVEAFQQAPSRTSRNHVLSLLAQTADAASSRVFELADETGREGMTSTLAAALFSTNTAFLIHVGDSRIYLLRQGELRQVTEDHSLVNEMLLAGSITPEDAEHSRYRNVITRAIGLYPNVHADTLAIDLLPGDRLLLCSDGLSDLVPPDSMAQFLAQPDIADSVECLVDLALEAGGKDNITVIGIEPVIASPTKLATERAAVLERLFLFADLPDQARIRVNRIVSDQSVLAHTEVVTEDAPGDTMYVVVHGTFGVFVGGKQVATLSEGEHFGELCLVDTEPRSATIRALTDGHLIAIDRDTLRNYCAMEPEVGNRILWRLLSTLSQRLRATNHRVATLNQT